ncbi:MAG: M48 family metalloprotease [Actinobacteria bacterium]|nr:M48 family metalloprotease [Actinomycetota bacterium]MSW24488.1 M48 family metalloprotease [Actinomycetota bacterium]MSX29622.1 M48 family metalloprotease [Actinomycetota bacterium]MSX43732.1 M48 family metalloprotease [Actinomycetota bacterium]MSX97801.1 M48 family metalloprotease [Actinomycetota bacterium]
MGSLTAFVIYAVALYLGYASLGVIPFAIGISLIGVWGSYYSSDKIVLSMTGAKLIDHDSAPQLFNLVQEITIASGLPMPKVAIVEDAAPNAFATGRDPEHAVIAFTTGILQVMDREQLQGVAAHELAHVANRDTLVSAVAATTAGAIALLSDFLIRISLFGGGRRDNNDGANPFVMVAALVAALLAPIAAVLLKAAISRKREALADATAVAFTRNPTGLRRALETLAADSTVVHQKSNAMAHLWIESPLDSRMTSKLFATHPAIEDRIANLRALEKSGPVTL